MKTLLVYDSFFGNTEQIAYAIGNILSSQEGETIRVTKVTPRELLGVKLLVIGSPTRGFRPTEAITKFRSGQSNFFKTMINSNKFNVLYGYQTDNGRFDEDSLI